MAMGRSTQAQGTSATASGEYSVAAGDFSLASGHRSKARVHGSKAHSNGGCGQEATYHLCAANTSPGIGNVATARVLTANDEGADVPAPDATNQIALIDEQALSFKGIVVAQDAVGGSASAWEIKGLVKRGTGAASVALVGTPTVTMLYQDAAAASWAVQIAADTTHGALKISGVGASGVYVRWYAKVDTVEVVGSN
jgi:hypothetical protein